MASEKLRKSVCRRVAEILREERIRKGFSMTVLGDRAGLSQQMVSYVERGMRNPTLDTLLRLTAVLEIELADVLKRASATAARDSD